MRNKQWIKAGLLTATLIGLATPALAQRGDDDNGGRNRRGGGEARGGGDNRGGGRQDNGGGEARARPDNGGDRGQSFSAPQPAPVAEGPRVQRDYAARPGTPEARGVTPAAPPPPVVVAAAPNGGAGRQGQAQAQAQGRANGGWQNGGDRDRGDRGGRPGNGGASSNDNRGGDNRGGGDWRNNDNRGNNDLRDRDRNNRGNDWRGNDNRGGDWRGNDGRGSRPPIANRWQSQRPWSNDWRRDNRYNWQYWRNSHRSIFRLPNYYPPYGWSRGYSRFSIGGYINDILFGTSYWIDDPYRYRLPPAYGTLRWVRYYNDALLVDIRDGYVVDIVYDVFW